MEWLIALGVAFATIGLAELADKTQLVCISQACRYSFWPVLAGSAVALIIVTGVAVLAGSALDWLLPGNVLSIIAGVLFLAFGVLMLVRWYRGNGNEEDPLREVEPESDGSGSLKAFGSTFWLMIAAEMGDKTQLAVIALTGEYGNPLAIFVGASAALVLVSAVGIGMGRLMAKRIPLSKIEVVAAILFIVLGAWFLLGAF
jgi:putative Ca2+/H+ antiporter (TMEM165/GDT1 family)